MTSMTRVLPTALLGLVLAAGTAPSYALVDPHPVAPFVPGANDEPALTAAWQRWRSKQIDDYVVSVRLSCFCVPTDPVRTLIRDDATRRVTQGERRLRAARGWSMDELFSTIRRAQAEADRVEVDFTLRGVPRSITIDPDVRAADEETYYSVSLSRLR
jgi:hypothetical protein